MVFPKRNYQPSVKIFGMLPLRIFISIFFGKTRINLGVSLCLRAKRVPFPYQIFLHSFQSQSGNIMSQKGNVQFTVQQLQSFISLII